jgi:hypothetical protein
MLSVEDWAEIRRVRRAEGLPIKVIARVLGISKNTVKVALASDQAPKYERRPQGSTVDEVEPRIRELLQAYPRAPLHHLRAGPRTCQSLQAPRIFSKCSTSTANFADVLSVTGWAAGMTVTHVLEVRFPYGGQCYLLSCERLSVPRFNA